MKKQYRIEWMHNGNWRYDDVLFTSLRDVGRALETENYKPLKTRVVVLNADGIPCANMKEFDKIMGY